MIIIKYIYHSTKSFRIFLFKFNILQIACPTIVEMFGFGLALNWLNLNACCDLILYPNEKKEAKTFRDGHFKRKMNWPTIE